MIGIYQQLIGAPNLEKAVAALTDDELREVRGQLGRGEHENWPAALVHGVCMVECAERFMTKDTRGQKPEASDKCHGSEVRL
jgi:hypothetical protein